MGDGRDVRWQSDAMIIKSIVFKIIIVFKISFLFRISSAMGYEVGVNILRIVFLRFISPHMLTASARSPGLQGFWKATRSGTL
jgi:hypothetical protein